MTLSMLFAGFTALMAAKAAPFAGPTPEGMQWPSFRGTNARGIAEGYSTPLTWNAEKSENVRWKTPIPGLGHSSPVIWGNRLFVTTAINQKKTAPLKIGLYGAGESADDNDSQQWNVYCLDKRTGKILWQRTAHVGVPRLKRHPKGTHANPTAATDGKHLVAFFGSEGLYCYDVEGKLLWKKDFGLLRSAPGVYDNVPHAYPELEWGFASSPIIHENRVIVECDVLGNGFIESLDIRDGTKIWRTPRDDTSTWSTPTVFDEGGRSQLIVNGWKHMGGYDARTGKEIWRLAGGGDVPVPTPIVSHGLIFLMSAHGPKSPIFAVHVGAKGDTSLQGSSSSNDKVAWSYLRGGAYMATPIVYGEYLYSCNTSGALACYEVKTGKSVYLERLGTGRTGFTASPVASGGKLYITSEEGDVYVVKAGPAFKVLATNSMGEVCMATPAISEGTLFFRTQGHVVAIAQKQSGATKAATPRP